MGRTEVDFLEQDVLEVLSLVRSTKNTFAPINRIPPDVLVLIPQHCDTYDDLITLTQVCRGWRENFISHSALWTGLNCTHVEWTRISLERSKTSPLDISLKEGDFLNDAFLLTVSHLHNLGALTISGSSNSLLRLTKHLDSPSPLLKKLKIVCTRTKDPVIIKDTMFNGSLSSLHELRLSGVITNLAWKNMANLRTFDLQQVPSNKLSVTQLLNFFERAPLLRKIILRQAFPNSSDSPLGRVVSLPNLKYLILAAQPAHTILLNHLLMPVGTSVYQGFDFSGARPPFPSHIPQNPQNLKNLLNITSVNLIVGLGVSFRLKGPNGELYMLGNWVGDGLAPNGIDKRALLSLKLFPISTAEHLTIACWRSGTSPSPEVNKSPVYLTFLSMKNLRVLTLTNCRNHLFFLVLNPNKNQQKIILCPKLEELVVYIKSEDLFYVNELLEMAEERASRGVKLETVTIVSSKEFVPAKEVLKLRNYASSVEYRLDDIVPNWDESPLDVEDAVYDSDW
ncbi:hypothetical protein BJ322DRAFT_1081770 [Thelephora terrestris]|uniref:F-box domain-containing protein n=1 Tax=Thelephora terrestris TaxID=56493 RepID=A0A9P6H794_9AGAM|nr:hypothetical protein BJ322DRAFT_1081770 [Thelephora terrestris]